MVGKKDFISPKVEPLEVFCEWKLLGCFFVISSGLN